jgi:hypothetical protein
MPARCHTATGRPRKMCRWRSALPRSPRVQGAPRKWSLPVLTTVTVTWLLVLTAATATATATWLLVLTTAIARATWLLLDYRNSDSNSYVNPSLDNSKSKNNSHVTPSPQKTAIKLNWNMTVKVTEQITRLTGRQRPIHWPTDRHNDSVSKCKYI